MMSRNAPNAPEKPDSQRAAEVLWRILKLRQFARRHFAYIEKREDYDILLACAYSHFIGRPLNLKQLFAYGFGSQKTLHRHVTQLKQSGLIEEFVDPEDRRNKRLRLSHRFLDDVFVYVQFALVTLWPTENQKPSEAAASAGREEF